MSKYSSSSSAEASCPPMQLKSLTAGSIVCSGWLYRQSVNSFLRPWRCRFFVLCDERLYVFKENEPSSAAHSMIDLARYRTIRRVGEQRSRRSGHGMVLGARKRPSVFDEQSASQARPGDEEEIELYSDNAAELDVWVDAISKVIVDMDVRSMSFSSPLASFDSLLQQAGAGRQNASSIREKLAHHRAAVSSSPLLTSARPLSNASSSSTLVSTPVVDGTVGVSMQKHLPALPSNAAQNQQCPSRLDALFKS